jgi:LPXTG-site transpeptidase (sortase) family protein
MTALQYMSKVKIIALIAIGLIWVGVIGAMLVMKPDLTEQVSPDYNEMPIISIKPTQPVQTTSEDGLPSSNGPSFSSLFVVSDQNQTERNNAEQSATVSNSQNNNQVPIRLPTGEKVPVSGENGPANTLVYSDLKIKAPILYASLADLFEKNPDGTIDTTRQIQETPGDKTHLSTPAQRLLTKGIVHLGFTPLPGEFGNSYIVGHSSNYANVVSNYNYIFKDLKNAKTGDVFTIYNQEGKGMNFKVFENIVVNESDIGKAYESYGDKRVVTLQASVLVRVNGSLLPLKRQLVRGELVN